MSRRSSGILMHISSLPSKYGIGDFGEEAYKFIDFLVEAGQKYWQILPLGVTGFGDSPYQCFSAFAGNPYFIDLNEFIERGYLDRDTIKDYRLFRNPKTISYDLLYENKMELLRIAYEKSKIDLQEDLDKFMNNHKAWLREFALFMALKEFNGNVSWLEWDDEFKDINSESVLKFEKEDKDGIYFWVFTQYFFSKQWMKLKEYANKNKIKIIGDLPIYVSIDSSDVWANTEIFNLDDSFNPITVAGVPPDYFSKEGQLWGNPIYNWDAMEEDKYKWWIERISHSFNLFDSLRIDHFIGFVRYWEVEYGEKNAVDGKWSKGPGIKLFKRIREELGDLDIIAEDLGVVTKEVRELMKLTGFPGMKVLQFSFNPEEDSEFLIHNHHENSIVYTSTHDSPTVIGWSKEQDHKTLKFAREYLNMGIIDSFNWSFIRGAWSSSSYLAIAQIQDFLGLDDRARINIPSTLGDNWNWRLDGSKLDNRLRRKINHITKLYRR